MSKCLQILLLIFIYHQFFVSASDLINNNKQ